MRQLIKVALTQQKIYVPVNRDMATQKEDTSTGSSKLRFDTIQLIARLREFGYRLSDEAVGSINTTTTDYKVQVIELVGRSLGKSKNWTPLRKNWTLAEPATVTGRVADALSTFFGAKSITLPCGDRFAADTFHLGDYNGCPVCGTQFEYEALELFNKGSKAKTLQPWYRSDAEFFLRDLLLSKTALDASQIENLKILLDELAMPEVIPAIKETLMLVIDHYKQNDKPGLVQNLFTSPTDILRYLWYKHTGFLQIIEPKTIIKIHGKNNRHIYRPADLSGAAKLITAAQLKLKYSRKECKIVAGWMNALPQEAGQLCEIMHPKRDMWVRVIRALRLYEYSKRPGFEKLAETLDKFYRKDYQVWQGAVNNYRIKYDATKAFELLQQRPGLFARSLFANMLWFGPEDTLEAFSKVSHKVPARLLVTLGMYAENYFSRDAERVVKPITGVAKRVATNPLVNLYDESQLAAMQKGIQSLFEASLTTRFSAVASNSESIYIDPQLFDIPLPIGERSSTVQDNGAVLQGTKFRVEGSKLRLFMQWGEGLAAQHLDMDLSCMIAYESRFETCSYYSMTPRGCRHSGDVRSIPHMKGTAEYIEIDIEQLKIAGAKYVSFSCNAYSSGSITPNLVVGWMNSAYNMSVSTSGVAYDPSCVQHQARITRSLTKGLVFGVLDIRSAEITWLEMQVEDQTVAQLDVHNVELTLKKLRSRLSIGQLLLIKAEAQELELIEDAVVAVSKEKLEFYDLNWARNTAAVTQLLPD